MGPGASGLRCGRLEALQKQIWMRQSPSWWLREGRRLPSLGNLHQRSSRPFTPAFSGSVLLGDLDDLPEFLEKVLIQSER